MISKKLSKYVFFGTFIGVMALPAIAFASETAAVAPVTMAGAVKTLGAAMCMGISAIGAGWAQAKIGSAGQGTLAERPECGRLRCCVDLHRRPTSEPAPGNCGNWVRGARR